VFACSYVVISSHCRAEFQVIAGRGRDNVCSRVGGKRLIYHAAVPQEVGSWATVV
jgi:hypothetical protein